ncbi:MAG TPA: hypothetical protein VFI28_00215 [Candidatus Limnocylindrales bacterium]|nr:hypothetical protein [Candidatus Limnocylindrales bacterium]
MRVRVLASIVAASALLVAVAGPVGAAAPSSAYAPPVVNWVQPTVVAHPDGTATVHVRYTCSGGNVGTHLYIGLKQGPEVNAIDHTSSQYAETFYSTNWNSDGPGLSLNCNGRTQNALFLLKPDPYFWNAANAPLLSAGRAFVQVCIFDNTNTGDTDPNGFAFDYSMRKVVTG